MPFFTWTDLATVIERVAGMRPMTTYERRAYQTVVAELREVPLAGRCCNGCGGPILQRPFDDKGSVTFDYDCTCPGSEPLDKSLPWTPVPPKATGIEI